MLFRSGARATGWKVADVGLGQPTTAGGALSVDLALIVPYADPQAAQHTLAVDDHTTVSAPGEAEISIEESPGVRVSSSHLATYDSGIELVFRFSGNAQAPGEREVIARFVVGAEVRPAAPRRPWPLILGGAAVVTIALAASLARRARRARRAS